MSKRIVRLCCQPSSTISIPAARCSLQPTAFNEVTAAFPICFTMIQSRKCCFPCPRQSGGDGSQLVLVLEGGSCMKNTSLGSAAVWVEHAVHNSPLKEVFLVFPRAVSWRLVPGASQFFKDVRRVERTLTSSET